MIFLILFIFFLVDWIVFWGILHLVGGGIHLLLVLAIIFLIAHLFRHHRHPA
jgi:hypothetical protein